MLSTSVAIASLWQAINLSCYSSAINPVCVTVFLSLLFWYFHLLSIITTTRVGSTLDVCCCCDTCSPLRTIYIITPNNTTENWWKQPSKEVSLHGRHKRNIYHTKKLLWKNWNAAKLIFFPPVYLFFPVINSISLHNLIHFNFSVFKF